jgi:DNA-binding NtrC family response regulator
MGGVSGSINSEVIVSVPQASVLVVGTSSKANASLLAESGLLATPCPTGKLALEVLARERYQAVLWDLDMPGSDAMEQIRRISADFPHVAFIALTKPQDLRRGMLAMISGAAGYIQSPLHPKTVAQSFESALKRKQLESALNDLTTD